MHSILYCIKNALEDNLVYVIKMLCPMLLQYFLFLNLFNISLHNKDWQYKDTNRYIIKIIIVPNRFNKIK